MLDIIKNLQYLKTNQLIENLHLALDIIKNLQYLKTKQILMFKFDSWTLSKIFSILKQQRWAN